MFGVEGAEICVCVCVCVCGQAHARRRHSHTQTSTHRPRGIERFVDFIQDVMYSYTSERLGGAALCLALGCVK